MQKKTLALILTLCLIFTMLPVSVLAADPTSGTCGDNVTWTLGSDGTLTISGTGEMKNMRDYGTEPTPWHSLKESILHVVVEEGVTSIGSHAFRDCSALTEVELPAGITTIGSGAFFGCTALTEVTLPDGVTVLGDASFGSCTALTAINIPDSVTTIGARVFNGCTALTSLRIPAGTTFISEYTLNSCTSLKEIQVDENNPAYCTGTDGALYSKDMTQLIQVPGGFEGTFVIPDTVTGLSSGVFEGCTSLTAVEFPDSLTHIGSFAFRSCTALTEFKIPRTITSIGDGAFSMCTSLVKVQIPNSVTSLGMSVFYGCTALTEVTLPSGISSLPEGTFRECTSLNNVYFPYITFIGNNSFKDCTSLTTLYLPAEITWIGVAALSGCTALTDIYFAGSAEQWDPLPVGHSNDPLFTATAHLNAEMPAPPVSFTDVFETDWYYDAVYWAVDKEVTTGTSSSTFSPLMDCSRAQVVTFLYRAAGSPEVSGENPFTDVSEDAWYYNAVLWAVEKGITSGTTATTFAPDMACSRSQVVTFLYRAAGAPEVSGSNPFSDVTEGSWYYNAVLWAVENSITSGTTATTFAPDMTCSRSQVVTFLYRAED